MGRAVRVSWKATDEDVFLWLLVFCWSGTSGRFFSYRSLSYWMVTNHAWGDDCRFCWRCFCWTVYCLSRVVGLKFVHPGADRTKDKQRYAQAVSTTRRSGICAYKRWMADKVRWDNSEMERFGDLIFGDWMKRCWNVDQFVSFFPLDLVNHYRNHLTQVFGVAVYPISVFEKIPYCFERSRKTAREQRSQKWGFSASSNTHRKGCEIFLTVFFQ